MCCFAFPTPTSLLARLLTRPIRVRNTQIFARLDGDHQPSRHEVLPTKLIVRGSGEIRNS